MTPVPQPAPTNPLAIVALVAAFVVPPAGIVCGHIALGRIRASGEQGRELALAGTVVGYVLTAAIVLFLIAWIGVFVSILGVVLGITAQLPRS